MFTTEMLDESWKQMEEFEKDNFGLRYGDDFPMIARILSQSNKFITLGGLMQMLGSLEMAGLHEKAKTDKGVAEKLMTKPGIMHEAFAQMFYLGYKLGKSDCEREQLKQMSK